MNQLSFIIPAYNEQDFIAETLTSIKNNVPSNYSYEIIVIDHGSTDNTSELASSNNALVLNNPKAETISELRNFGVANSSGELLVFVDADTSLTAEWESSIVSIVNDIQNNPNLLTGSKRVIPSNSSWLNKAWFYSPRRKYSPGHLGGGHMIMSRSLFDKLGGFATDLETGEDFELCQRARSTGATIVSHPELKAIHRGVPTNISEFFNREVWHGRGDAKNLSLIIKSNVTIISIIFLLFHIILVLSIFLYGLLSSYSLYVFLSIFSICILSSLMKSKTLLPNVVLGNTILFYAYYWARAISLIDVAIYKQNIKRSRKA